MSIADLGTNVANINQPRAVYFDIYTTPGSLYIPTTVEVVMPETVIGNGIPAATVCSVQIYYVGMYSTCVQKEYINTMANGRISYYQRFKI